MHKFFFFNDTATTEIYTLSLHDALPILSESVKNLSWKYAVGGEPFNIVSNPEPDTNDLFLGRLNSLFEVIRIRSEEHTSELQSQSNLVCRLLLEKKK